MSAERPNPDELLARVQADAARARRGKLKIFFGYAAGVGKTYATLEAAQRARAEGIDVVVGYVEPHGRPETEALLAGLESLPPRLVCYRGVNLKEFDLDAALARRPQLIVVDELAHTNAEGMRHARRWQDVEELLSAGLDVWTTLNVQHVESLNDVIAQITGVVVRERIPDAVLEQADDIELVDRTPEELMERFREGRIYVAQQAERALQHFFQKGNLVALRELSLRQVAQRLNRDVEAARRDRAAQAPWATSERLLVCVGPSPTSARLIRTAKRMAAALGAPWLAVAVEAPGAAAAAAQSRQQVMQHLRLAERLGAETQTLFGNDVAQTILDHARARNVTKIIVGKTSQPRWKRFLWGTVVDVLVDRSGDIDVYIIRGEEEAARPPQPPAQPAGFVCGNYLRAALVVALCGLAGWLTHAAQLSETSIVMVFLLGVVHVAARHGRGPAIAASVAGVLVFDFLFVPPYLSFSVYDAQYLFTFAVMLIIALVISALTARIRDQLRAAQQSEGRTAALFRLTRQLSQAAGQEFLIGMAGRQVGEVFDGEVVLFLRDAAGPLELRFGHNTSVARHEVNAVVARWVADHEQIAGPGTDTLPNATTALFVPLTGSQGVVGALGVRPNEPARFQDPEQRRLLEACASLIALSLERDRSMLEAQEAQLRMQAEQLRNALLSAVSHDLRTPLAAITGASSSLLDAHADAGHPSTEAQRELLQTIQDESRRLSRLVDNLLDMTRLTSGTPVLDRQWHVLEEVIGSVPARLRRELAQHTLHVDVPDDLPLVFLDGVWMEQVFYNLLENAARYTPPRSRIEITARREGRSVVIRVADNGPGLPPGSEARIFEKFYRGPTATGDDRRGVGLGLTIGQTILEAHGGHIQARNRPGGGAEFTLTLPCEMNAPPVALDEIPAGAGS